jgi:hypothetical protein
MERKISPADELELKKLIKETTSPTELFRATIEVFDCKPPMLSIYTNWKDDESIPNLRVP